MKRLFDTVVAAVLLVVLAPLFAVIAFGVRLAMGRPMLFRQLRPGLGGTAFEIMKFRTMSSALDSKGQPLPDHARLNRFGRFLRRASLDELPELINVLKGDMSLVGPRPLLMQYLDRYTPTQARRHEVRPGITGWAQVNGRNAISWEERFQLDVWYVDHRGFWLDLKILALTAVRILRGDDINQPGHATRQEFMGSRS